jgi:CheY-like chemotaxis protein
MNITANKTAINSIVLADDDQDDLSIFQDVLSSLNKQITLDIVSNGNELMSLLDHYCPDLLFLDLEMPYKNGLECLVEIKKKPSLNNLPIVIFSSTTRPSNIQTAYDMGGHLFLVKSALYKEHYEAIKAILNMDWSNPNAIKENYCVNGRYVAFS